MESKSDAKWAENRLKEMENLLNGDRTFREKRRYINGRRDGELMQNRRKIDEKLTER